MCLLVQVSIEVRGFGPLGVGATGNTGHQVEAKLRCSSEQHLFLTTYFAIPLAPTTSLYTFFLFLNVKNFCVQK